MKVIIDIGATNTRFTTTKDNKAFGEVIIYETPSEYEAGFKKLIDTIKENTDASELMSVIAGFPSAIRSDGTLHNVTHLPKWTDRNLRNDLETELSVPVRIENDLVLVGAGEAIYGAGKDNRIVAYVTVSTGVNAVKFVDGKLDANSLGFEVGHQIIDPNSDQVCGSCGTKGDLDVLVGGDAIEKRMGKKPREIKDPLFWEGVADNLSIGLHNIILHFSPDVVVLGGAMMRDIPIERLRNNLDHSLKILPEVPLLKPAELADKSGLYGGLIMEAKSSDSSH